MGSLPAHDRLPGKPPGQTTSQSSSPGLSLGTKCGTLHETPPAHSPPKLQSPRHHSRPHRCTGRKDPNDGTFIAERKHTHTHTHTHTCGRLARARACTPPPMRRLRRRRDGARARETCPACSAASRARRSAAGTAPARASAPPPSSRRTESRTAASVQPYAPHAGIPQQPARQPTTVRGWHRRYIAPVWRDQALDDVRVRRYCPVPSRTSLKTPGGTGTCVELGPFTPSAATRGRAGEGCVCCTHLALKEAVERFGLEDG